MNGYQWHVRIVDHYSEKLVDRTGGKKLATTDPNTHCIYLSSDLSGDFFTTVLIHELGHCAIISFDLTREIRRMVKPQYWIEAEEFLCNFIADYGMLIFRTAYKLFGDQALIFVPSEIERMIA